MEYDALDKFYQNMFPDQDMFLEDSEDNRKISGESSNGSPKQKCSSPQDLTGLDSRLSSLNTGGTEGITLTMNHVSFAFPTSETKKVEMIMGDGDHEDEDIRHAINLWPDAAASGEDASVSSLEAYDSPFEGTSADSQDKDDDDNHKFYTSIRVNSSK